MPYIFQKHTSGKDVYYDTRRDEIVEIPTPVFRPKEKTFDVKRFILSLRACILARPEVKITHVTLGVKGDTYTLIHHTPWRTGANSWKMDIEVTEN